MSCVAVSRLGVVWRRIPRADARGYLDAAASRLGVMRNLYTCLSMSPETVSQIAIIDGSLHLVLTTEGQDWHQFIYREARSVYWDADRRSFKCSTSIPGLPFQAILPHMIQVISDFGITLSFEWSLTFADVPDDATMVMRDQIKQYSSR